MPANGAESQLLEAWPASIYGHLREWTFPRVLEISQGAWKRSQIKELHNKGSDIVFIKSRNRSDVEPLSIIIGLNSRVGANSNEPEN